MEDEKPDTSHLVLKPKVVDPIDKVATPGDGTAISVQAIHQQNVQADERRAARKKPSLANEAPQDFTVPPGFKVRAPEGATVPAVVKSEGPRVPVEALLAPPPVRRDGTLPPGFKRPEIEAVNAPAPVGGGEPIRVYDMLAENLDVEEASGLGQLKKQPRRKRRRTRDFILVVGTVDLGLAAMIKYSENPMMMVYGLAAMALVTSTLGWIMFFVMDNY